MPRIFLLTLMAVLLTLSPGWGANSAKNFGGIGIDGVPMADGRVVVKQLVTGGPAHRAGIRIGDVITHIDSKPTKGNDFKEIVEYRLRGRAGTRVLLTVHRPGRKKPLHFTLVRKQLIIR